MSPTPFERQPLPIDGHLLYYEEHSSGDETFIFMHGVTGSLPNWYGLIAPFKARGRVVLLNLPGHYPATFPPGYTEDQITPEAWGDLGGRAVAAMTGGKPATLIGHSTGGFWALAIAHRAPALVRRAVSIGGFARGEWSGLLGFHQRMLLALPTLYRPIFAAEYRALSHSAKLFTTGWRVYNPRLRAPLDRQAVAQAAADSPHDYARLDMRAMATVFRAMRHHVDMRDGLGEIEAPVLAVTGDEDPIVPRRHADLIAARRRPRSPSCAAGTSP